MGPPSSFSLYWSLEAPYWERLGGPRAECMTLNYLYLNCLSSSTEKCMIDDAQQLDLILNFLFTVLVQLWVSLADVTDASPNCDAT